MFLNIFNAVNVLFFYYLRNLVVAKSTAVGGLHNSNSIGDMLIALKDDSSKTKGSKLNHMFGCGIDVMDFKESLENLLVLSDNYLTNDCL